MQDIHEIPDQDSHERETANYMFGFLNQYEVLTIEQKISGPESHEYAQFGAPPRKRNMGLLLFLKTSIENYKQSLAITDSEYSVIDKINTSLKNLQDAARQLSKNLLPTQKEKAQKELAQNTVQKAVTDLQADILTWFTIYNKSSLEAQLLCKSFFLFAKTMSITLDEYFAKTVRGALIRKVVVLFAPQSMDADYIKRGHETLQAIAKLSKSAILATQVNTSLLERHLKDQRDELTDTADIITYYQTVEKNLAYLITLKQMKSIMDNQKGFMAISGISPVDSDKGKLLDEILDHLSLEKKELWHDLYNEFSPVPEETEACCNTYTNLFMQTAYVVVTSVLPEWMTSWMDLIAQKDQNYYDGFNDVINEEIASLSEKILGTSDELNEELYASLHAATVEDITKVKSKTTCLKELHQITDATKTMVDDIQTLIEVNKPGFWNRIVLHIMGMVSGIDYITPINELVDRLESCKKILSELRRDCNDPAVILGTEGANLAEELSGKIHDDAAIFSNKPITDLSKNFWSYKDELKKIKVLKQPPEIQNILPVENLSPSNTN